MINLLFSLTDQIRRSSRAVGARIADCGYLSQPQVAALMERCAELGHLLGGMMAKAELFAIQKPFLYVKSKPLTSPITEPRKLDTDD